VSQKKHAALFLGVTLANVDWFSKFFHCWTQKEICNKTIIVLATTL